jgi:hypothetical protein
MDGDFGLEFGDARGAGHQLGVLAAGRSPQLPGVDQILPPPHVDRLLADNQVGNDLSHRTTGATRSGTLRETRRDTSSAPDW